MNFNRNTWLLVVIAQGCILQSSPVAKGRQVEEPTEIRESFHFVTRDHRERFDPATFFPLFESADFKLVPPDDKKLILPYRLFRPVASEGETFPLIVWIHGYGDDEIDFPNLGQLKHLQLIFRDAEHPAKYPFYLLAPQNVVSPDWFSAQEKASQHSHGDLVLELINNLVAHYPIDPDRITLVGISSGGTAAWEFAARRPDLFAAIVPMGSSGGEGSQLDRLIGVQVWAFHASQDAPDGDRRAVSYLHLLGRCAQLTEIEGDEHNCWYAAFRDHDLLHWILARRKGSDCDFPSSPMPEVAIRFGAAYWPQITMAFAVACILLELSRRFRRG